MQTEQFRSSLDSAATAAFLLLSLIGGCRSPVRAPGVEALHYRIDSADGRTTTVTLTFVDGDRPVGELRLPEERFNSDGQDKSVRNVRLLSGSLRPNDSGDPRVVRFHASPTGVVAVRYEVVQTPPTSPTGGAASKPYFDHSGENLWAFPTGSEERPIPITLEWHVPPDWTLVNPYGQNERRQSFVDTIGRFRHATYLAGDHRVSRVSALGKPITIARRGSWKFSDAEFDGVLRKIYEAEAEFWHDDDFLYRLVVLHPADGDAGNFGGEGRTKSFDLFLSPKEELSRGPMHLIAHELFHGWNPGKMNWDGDKAYWFTEGFTDYGAAVILRRAGLASEDDHRAFINQKLREYHRSPAKNLPYETLLSRRDEQECDRMIYTRGLLLALNWDAAIRAATHGAASLDDALRSLARAARDDPAFALDDRRIANEVGRFIGATRAEKEIADVITAGATLRPDPRALGDAFEAREQEFAAFDLGFDPQSIARRVISGVRPGGAAHAAGARDGLALVGFGFSPGNPDAPVELSFLENGVKRTIHYFPRGDGIKVPQFLPKARSSRSSSLEHP